MPARIKSEKTAPVAWQLAHLLRFVLYETRKPTIPLAREMQILKDYIALEQLRFDEDRLLVTTQIEMDDPQQKIAPLLLLPMEALLSGLHFMRPHRSYLVALPHVTAFTATEVFVAGQCIPIGRQFKEAAQIGLERWSGMDLYVRFSETGLIN